MMTKKIILILEIIPLLYMLLTLIAAIYKASEDDDKKWSRTVIAAIAMGVIAQIGEMMLMYKQ